MTRGKFIVVDGMDGSGKGTQIKLLQEEFKNKSVIFTREPGGTPKAEEIRELILKTNGPPSNALCDFFLFWASRGSHVEDHVTPMRDAEKHVISDRYDSSTYAFQICGEEQQHLLPLFKTIRNTLGEKYAPDLYIVLDLPAEVAYERRAKDASQAKSKFDIKPLEYHQRVRDGFKQFGQFAPVRFIDANRPIEAVWTDIKAAVQSLIH